MVTIYERNLLVFLFYFDNLSIVVPSKVARDFLRVPSINVIVVVEPFVYFAFLFFNETVITKTQNLWLFAIFSSVPVQDKTLIWNCSMNLLRYIFIWIFNMLFIPDVTLVSGYGRCEKHLTQSSRSCSSVRSSLSSSSSCKHFIMSTEFDGNLSQWS